MTFGEYHFTAREKIEDYFSKTIRQKEDANLSPSIKNLNFLSEIENFAMRGKLLRGTLFLLTCQMLGHEITDEHLAIAVSIELIHSGLLIHDDIIDNDRVRRGKKSVFAQYEERGREINAIDALHYGRSMAIVVADAAFFLSYEILSKCKSFKVHNLIEFLSNELYLVALAEGLDSELGQVNKEATEGDILSVYHYKTARYTFSMPFVMGCIYSGASKDVYETLDKLGEKAGVIFQLKDDEIGFFGKEEDIGKPVGSDIRENKKTLLRYLLFKKANNKDKQVLKKSFGNPNLSPKQIDEARLLAVKYGILDETKKYIDDNSQEVYRLFHLLPFKNKYIIILKQLLDYNLKRTY